MTPNFIVKEKLPTALSFPHAGLVTDRGQSTISSASDQCCSPIQRFRCVLVFANSDCQLQGYLGLLCRGARIFEAIGLRGKAFLKRAFGLNTCLRARAFTARLMLYAAFLFDLAAQLNQELLSSTNQRSKPIDLAPLACWTVQRPRSRYSRYRFGLYVTNLDKRERAGGAYLRMAWTGYCPFAVYWAFGYCPGVRAAGV